MKKKHLILIGFVLIALVGPLFAVHAQTNCGGTQPTGGGFVPLEPCSPLYQAEQQAAGQGGNVQLLLQTLYNICVGIAVVLAILQLTRAGITYMLSESITNKEQARHLIMASILGLLLVLSPVIVFSLIDPTMLNFSLNLDALQVCQEGSTNCGSPGGSPGGLPSGSPSGGATGASTGGSGCASGSGSC